jgi:hypothetical protein
VELITGTLLAPLKEGLDELFFNILNLECIKILKHFVVVKDSLIHLDLIRWIHQSGNRIFLTMRLQNKRGNVLKKALLNVTNGKN